MFNKVSNIYFFIFRSSTKGAMAAGVPGEVMGAWEAKQVNTTIEYSSISMVLTIDKLDKL